MTAKDAVIWAWLRGDLTAIEAIADGASVQDLESARKAVEDGTYRVAIRAGNLTGDEIDAICGATGEGGER